MPSALFDRTDAGWVPTGLARGPWDPRHCHGGPVSALLARSVDSLDDTDAWHVARLTIELTRPIGVGIPITLSPLVERPGRKVSLVATVAEQGGVEVARVRALRIRRADLAIPTEADMVAFRPPPDPAQVPTLGSGWARGADDYFHLDSAEHRFFEGRWDEPGPVAVWIRLTRPVVDGETPTPLQRVAAAADFGNGVSASLDPERFTFINPDLTIHLHRPLDGEWVGMRTRSFYGPLGVGLAESELFDGGGTIGRSCQSLLVDAR